MVVEELSIFTIYGLTDEESYNQINIYDIYIKFTTDAGEIKSGGIQFATLCGPETF